MTTPLGIEAPMSSVRLSLAFLIIYFVSLSFIPGVRTPGRSLDRRFWAILRGRFARKRPLRTMKQPHR